MRDGGKQTDKSTWAIGGGLLLGLGVGLFFLQQSALAFVGCLIGGLARSTASSATSGDRNAP